MDFDDFLSWAALIIVVVVIGALVAFCVYTLMQGDAIEGTKQGELAIFCDTTHDIGIWYQDVGYEDALISVRMTEQEYQEFCVKG